MRTAILAAGAVLGAALVSYGRVHEGEDISGSYFSLRNPGSEHLCLGTDGRFAYLGAGDHQVPPGRQTGGWSAVTSVDGSLVAVLDTVRFDHGSGELYVGLEKRPDTFLVAHRTATRRMVLALAAETEPIFRRSGPAADCERSP